MTIKFHVYCLTDCWGNKVAKVVNEHNDNLMLWGDDKDGYHRQFESCEAYHIHEWADKYGFTVDVTTHTLTLEN
jgi:hypothetical protein